MTKRVLASVLLFVILESSFLAFATSQDRENSLMTRMFGFQYPLDSDSGYKVGWITNFDESEIGRDFQAIRGNFPQVNLLRIPIGWEDMNNTILLTQMHKVIELGKNYSFKFMFVLMDRVSGWWDTGPNPRNLLPDQWPDQRYRITLVVSHFKSEGQIYAWALSNELNVFQEVVYEWYEHFIPFLKGIDPDTPVCTSFYPLGPNATTVSRAADLVKLGLDFLEFHYYPNSETDIDSEIDQLTAYVNKPIFLSEFNVEGGLNHYSTATNTQILNATVQNFQKRPNVIGLAYYRWSNDADNFTIWNSTAQAPRPEAAALTISGSFLSLYPYLEHSETNSTERYEIYDPSFANLTEWPNIKGWPLWSNHTACDMLNVSSTDNNVHPMTKHEITGYDFENGLADYYDERSGTGGSAIEDSIVYSMNHSLKMWADAGAEYQRQHTAIPIQPLHGYCLEAHVNITAQTGDAGAFIQLAFEDAYGSWISWPQSEYYTDITNWTLIHAAGIAPSNAVGVHVNCRVNGFSGSITTFFDYLTLYELEPSSYDGLSCMIAFGECTEPTWNAVQVSQNFTFPNPSEDIHKLWTFRCSLATVLSPEYDTDWKGAFVELAFTTSNSSEWITWYIGEYLSRNNQWTDLEVTGFPPSDAWGLQMIVRVVNCHYGVMYIDNASLTSQAAVVPEDWVMPVISEGSSFQVPLTISTVNNTSYNSTFVSPTSWGIIDSNSTWFKGNAFGSVINGTSETIMLTFGEAAPQTWTVITLILGIVGSVLLIAVLIIVVKRKNRTHAG